MKSIRTILVRDKFVLNVSIANDGKIEIEPAHHDGRQTPSDFIWQIKSSKNRHPVDDVNHVTIAPG
jgi:hypothetical protein